MPAHGEESINNAGELSRAVDELHPHPLCAPTRAALASEIIFPPRNVEPTIPRPD